jgi:hypothetical protein
LFIILAELLQQYFFFICRQYRQGNRFCVSSIATLTIITLFLYPKKISKKFFFTMAGESQKRSTES